MLFFLFPSGNIYTLFRNLHILLTFTNSSKHLKNICEEEVHCVAYKLYVQKCTCCVIDACMDNRNNRRPTGPRAELHPAWSIAPQFPPARTHSRAWQFAESPRSPCEWKRDVSWSYLTWILSNSSKVSSSLLFFHRAKAKIKNGLCQI